MNRLRKATVLQEKMCEIRKAADEADAKGRFTLAARYHEQADQVESEILDSLRAFAAEDVPELVKRARELADFLEEAHLTNMGAEFPRSNDPMKRHRKAEPNCSYCRAIRETRETIGRLFR